MVKVMMKRAFGQRQTRHAAPTGATGGFGTRPTTGQHRWGAVVGGARWRWRLRLKERGIWPAGEGGGRALGARPSRSPRWGAIGG